MHSSESVLENETHKILEDFDIQTDYLISARPSDIQQTKIKTENLSNYWLFCSSKLQKKIEGSRKER